MKIIKKVAIIFPRMEETFSGGDNYVASLANHLSLKYETHIITRPSSNGVFPGLKGITLHYVEGLSSSKPDLLKVIPGLHDTLEEINPDYVHVHCFMTLMLYSLAVPKGRFKLLMTVHSTPDGKTKLFSWFNGLETQKTFISNLYKNTGCNVTLFGSDFYKREYFKHVPIIKRVSKCYVNKYYSELPSISLSKRKMFDKEHKDKVTILFPSRIVKRKGIEETLKLMTMLPDNYFLDLPALVQVENPEYHEFIKKMIKDYNLEDRIIVPEKKLIGVAMKPCFENSDIAIIPSYFEGFGIVAVEAMNTSLPVITTLTGGLSEIITDGYDGVKMSLDNLEEARDKIIRLAEDKKYRYEIIKNARKTYDEKFLKKRHMDLIDKIYEEL